MNLISNIPFIKKKDALPRQAISTSWDDRIQVLNKDVNLFCWKRPENKTISNYLNGISSQILEPISFYTSIDQLGKGLSDARKMWDPAHNLEADAFWVDIYRITRDFLLLAQVSHGKVHLKQIADNACRKFHVDGYKLRLFTTYFGEGTEWLPEDATNRKGLGKSNDIIVQDPLKIRQMNVFEVAILKGEIPGAKLLSKGIVHRSPQIEHTDKKRIILRVDI